MNRVMNGFFVFLTVAGLGFLSFFGGVLVGEYDVRPFYSLLRPAFALADLLCDRPMNGALLGNSGLWSARPAGKTGLVYAAPSKAFEGYTLLSSAHEQSAFLYDMQGELVHKWQLPFEQIWETPPYAETPAAHAQFYWRSMHLYPNGNLLVSCCLADNPRGYGLVLMDSESNPVWTLDERVAGAFSVDGAGRIHALVREIRNEPIPDLPQLVCPFIDDVLVTFSPEREVLSRVSLIDQAVKAVGGRNLSFLKPLPDGALGTSSIHPVSSALAGKFPAVNEGDLLVSMSAAGLLAIVSADTGKIEWIFDGPGEKQSCARASAAGDILLFDGQGLKQRGLKSAVVRLDPAKRKVTWLYSGQPGQALNSAYHAVLEELPNANLLVTEAMEGRIFELTPDRKVVWDWRSPFRAGKDDSFVAVVLGAKRYGKNEIDFKFNNGGREWF
ncbi:arylsulfotransferase family protein [Pontiella sp.]|uniref:arylsulfotransferase family protein n=1 Tax=Pontiella sp. TaxID=2837462 RepID=UPI0035662DC1